MHHRRDGQSLRVGAASTIRGGGDMLTLPPPLQDSDTECGWGDSDRLKISAGFWLLPLRISSPLNDIAHRMGSSGGSQPRNDFRPGPGTLVRTSLIVQPWSRQTTNMLREQVTV